MLSYSYDANKNYFFHNVTDSSDDIGRDSRRASLGAPLSRSSSPLRPASPAPTIRTELVEPQNTDSSNTMDTLKSLKEDVRRLTEEIQSVKKTLSTRASQGEKEIDQIEDRVSMLERCSYPTSHNVYIKKCRYNNITTTQLLLYQRRETKNWSITLLSLQRCLTH